MDRLHITMLGPSGSGKTTLLNGLYSVMAEGVEGFQLTCDDPDLDLDFLQAWDHFVETGSFFEATRSGDFQEYGFTFFDGFAPVVGFDVVDYRGGAVEETSDDDDNRRLVESIAKSSLIVILMDSENLVEGGRDNAATASRAARARRIQMYLLKAFAAPAVPPPFAIVLTKADVLEERIEREGMEEICDDVRQLFPSAFADGTLTMLCPVTVLGRARGAYSSDPSSVETRHIEGRNLHNILVFALLTYFASEARGSLQDLIPHAEAFDASQSSLLAMERSVLRFIRRGKIKEVERQYLEDLEQLLPSKQRFDESVERTRNLFDQLNQSELFRDGEAVLDETELFTDP